MELRIYLRMLRAGWWIIALTALAAVNIALAVSYIAPPKYQTTARLLVIPNTALMQENYDKVDSLRALDTPTIASTYSEFLQSDRTFNEAVVALGADPENIRKNYQMTAVVLPDSSVIQMTVAGPDPQLAAALANTISQRAIDYVTQVYQVYNLDFLDYAPIPDKPYSPQPLRNAGVALVLGIVLGSVLAIIREQLRTTLDMLFQQRRFDVVSQALNRRYFLRQLDQVALEKPGSLALALIHLEGLRDLLDTLPRAVSQGLLRHMTQTLKNELRGNDLVGRWSDTQFAILLPSTPAAGASRVLDRIQSMLSQPMRLEDGESVTLQPSVGIAIRRDDEGSGVLIEQAETALEQARHDLSKSTVVFDNA